MITRIAQVLKSEKCFISCVEKSKFSLSELEFLLVLIDLQDFPPLLGMKITNIAKNK